MMRRNCNTRATVLASALLILSLSGCDGGDIGKNAEPVDGEDAVSSSALSRNEAVPEEGPMTEDGPVPTAVPNTSPND